MIGLKALSQCRERRWRIGRGRCSATANVGSAVRSVLLISLALCYVGCWFDARGIIRVVVRGGFILPLITTSDHHLWSCLYLPTCLLTDCMNSKHMNK